MQPVVVTLAYPLGNATTIAQSQGSTSGAFQLNGTLGTAAPLGAGVLGTYQQRVTVTSGGNDSAIFFHIIGLNQAGFTVSEFLAGASTTVAQSNLDYRTVISITPSASGTSQTLATTASTVSAGTNQVGDSLWNIVNWYATPSNISYGCQLVTGAATFSIQYTYDDPNNLAVGQAFPQPFNHPTIVNATASIDGASNDPLTAWRLQMLGGTGTVRATGIQSGLGSP
jgi:hypothetical protein